MLPAKRTCEPSSVNVKTDENRRTAKNWSNSGSVFVCVTATSVTLQFVTVEATLPWAWYADPEILRREGERIFARAWQYVGHSGEIAEEGSTSRPSPGRFPL